MIKVAGEVIIWVVAIAVSGTILSVTAKSIRDLWRKK
jgi:hypothetical protein